MKKQLIIDVSGVFGFGLLIRGVWMLSQEMAFITAGLLLMLYAIKAKGN